MESIAHILMRRDGLDAHDAHQLILETREAVLEAIQSGDDAEEVFMECLGLEPDFIIDIL